MVAKYNLFISYKVRLKGSCPSSWKSGSKMNIVCGEECIIAVTMNAYAHQSFNVQVILIQLTSNLFWSKSLLYLPLWGMKKRSKYWFKARYVNQIKANKSDVDLWTDFRTFVARKHPYRRAKRTINAYT